MTSHRTVHTSRSSALNAVPRHDRLLPLTTDAWGAWHSQVPTAAPITLESCSILVFLVGLSKFLVMFWVDFFDFFGVFVCVKSMPRTISIDCRFISQTSTLSSITRVRSQRQLHKHTCRLQLHRVSPRAMEEEMEDPVSNAVCQHGTVCRRMLVTVST